jgi:D-glucosaminate-6-phosphate ammonia-lyase
MNLRQRLKDMRIVNACGVATRVGGALMLDEFKDLYELAFTSSYDLAELQSLASEVIVNRTGAEAGIVTSGASAGLLLAAAACLARNNAAIMDSLPITENIPNEIIMAVSHRNSYDHAIRASGATLRTVGIPDRVSGAGVRDAEIWEFEAAICDKTAAIAYVARENAEPNLGDLGRLARSRKIPIIVDAAGQVPPADNLRRFIDEGATLVVFSGGKILGGPQATGILFGKRDLVASALLQNLDLDVDEFDRRKLLSRNIFRDMSFNGFPHQGIGRSAKVGKESIVLFLFAFEKYQETSQQFDKLQESMCEEISTLIKDSNRINCRIRSDFVDYPFPILEVNLPGMASTELERIREVMDGFRPALRFIYPPDGGARLIINCSAMRREDIPYLAQSLLSQIRG